LFLIRAREVTEYRLPAERTLQFTPEEHLPGLLY